MTLNKIILVQSTQPLPQPLSILSWYYGLHDWGIMVWFPGSTEISLPSIASRLITALPYIPVQCICKDPSLMVTWSGLWECKGLHFSSPRNPPDVLLNYAHGQYHFLFSPAISSLTLRLLMSYIYGAPSKARNANIVYIWTYVWQRWNSLFLFVAQCFNTESMQRGFLCHICV